MPQQPPSVADKWSALPPATRKSIMQTVIQQSRDAAATAIMLQAQGGPSDIIKAATDRKMAASPLTEPVPPTGA